MENREYDYSTLMKRLNGLVGDYGHLKLSYIGTSLMSRPIPAVTIGDGEAKKGVLYVATHHASENICTSFIVDFIEEYARLITLGRYICGVNTRVLFRMRSITVVPMLNPDGVEYRLHGVSEDNPLYERVMKYNCGDDFTHWNANARGVDLNHNYNAYFDEYKSVEADSGITPGKSRYSGEAPESEPETAALTNYIRYNIGKISGILTFHSQGEEIFYRSQGLEAPRSEFIAKRISRMTGYALSEADGMASYGGLTDWFIKEFNKPSFTIECGRGENPLPMSQKSGIYTRLRETLYTFPILL